MKLETAGPDELPSLIESAVLAAVIRRGPEYARAFLLEQQRRENPDGMQLARQAVVWLDALAG